MHREFKISGLISVENEIAKRKLFLFVRMALSTSNTVLCKIWLGLSQELIDDPE